MQSIQATNTTLEDEQTSDMYSLGVVLWEILARRVRLGIWGAWMRTGQGRGQGQGQGRGQGWGQGWGKCRTGFGLTPWRDFHLLFCHRSRGTATRTRTLSDMCATASASLTWYVLCRTARVWVSIRA